jgi:hypothetical protein
VATATPHDAGCPGCLGENRCWVCLGTGSIENPGGLLSTCVRCGGTGDCTMGEDQRPARKNSA